MSKNGVLNSISSKYILQRTFLFLSHFRLLKLIRYNKNLQEKLKINFEDEIINYKYITKSKEEIKKDIKSISYETFENQERFGYLTNFCKKYSFFFAEYIDEDFENVMFLTQFKGFKINEYPLPSYFFLLSNEEKIDILKKHEYFLKYTLNDNNKELINLINELRKEKNMETLIYTYIQNLNDYFKVEKSKNEKYIFVYPKGEFKKKILQRDNNITQILLKKELNCIMILEKVKKECIIVYSFDKTIVNLNMPKPKNKENFHLINNIKPEINISKKYTKYQAMYINKIMNHLPKLKEPGYQVFSFKDETLLGVLEGPPHTPYENGFFLFKILIPKDYIFKPPEFYFISYIFHPNISENGNVYVDILRDQWSPALLHFRAIIISIQSLLGSPFPDEYLNKSAAKLYKEDINKYNETVREYTAIYSNYSKFMEDIKNIGAKYEIIDE